MNRALTVSLIFAAAGLTWILLRQQDSIQLPDLIEWLDPRVLGEPVVV